jgi:hypothetical protein
LAEEEEVNANNWIGTGLRPLARTGHCYLLLPVFVLDGIDADTAIGPALQTGAFDLTCWHGTCSLSTILVAGTRINEALALPVTVTGRQRTQR